MRRLSCVALVCLIVPLAVEAAPPDLRLVDAAKRNDPKASETLLKQGVDVNTSQPDGATPLHWAAHWDDLGTAGLLIQAGANVNAAADSGVTPLMVACLNGSAPMVDRLLQAGALPSAGRDGGAVMVAARTGNADVMRLLLTHGGTANARESERGQTALMWAAAEKHAAVLRVLIENGADVSARTVTNTPPPGSAGPAAGQAGRGAPSNAGRGMPPDAGRGAPPTAGRGAQPNAGRGAQASAGRGRANGANGFTALQFAARVGDLDSVRLLVDAGANPNETTDDGMSALVMATVRGFPSVATLLLEKGADPNADGAGFTALHWAAGSWETELTVTSVTIDRQNEWATLSGLRDGRLELVKKLLVHGADPNARMARTPARPGSSKNPDLPELQGATPFLLAAMAGAPDVMRALVAGGADVRMRTTGNGTPLMAAAGLGRVTGEVFVPESQTLAAAKLVVELGGADVNAVDALGNTALHYAAYLRRDSIVQLLANEGADREVKNKFGETPLFLAELGIQFAGGGIFEIGPSSTGTLLRKLGAQPIQPPYKLRPRYWPDIPHV